MLDSLLTKAWLSAADTWQQVATKIRERTAPPPPSKPPVKELVEGQIEADPPKAFPPLDSLIGNERAGRRLRRAAYDAWTQSPRSASGFSCAFIGPASTGKTEHARQFAASVCLPFVEIQPQSVKDIAEVYAKIREDVHVKKIRNPITDKYETFWCADHAHDCAAIPTKVTLPPCVVFIDEVHQLRPKIVQGLLKATEHSDRSLVTDDGVTVDTSHVCWIIATTERGKLFGPFDTRFTKIQLRLYSKLETARIIKGKYPQLPDDACHAVSHYCRSVPREAMAFAREMISEQKQSKRVWSLCAEAVAKDNGIDRFGMTLQRVAILTALSKGPVPKNRLASFAAVKDLELERFVLPPMMTPTPDQPEPLISVCARGYILTDAALPELDKRQIAYDADKAIPSKFRR